MIYLYIILWLIFGILGTMNIYYSSLKSWYLTFNEDYRLWNNGSGVINKIGFYAILFIPGGLLSFLIIMCMILILEGTKSFTYYFKIPN
jgi:hypothetical protein